MSVILYLCIDKNIEVQKKEVFLSDVAKMSCEDNAILAKCKAIKILNINSEKNERYVFSIMKVVDLIQKLDPKIEICNLGELDFILDYKPPKKPNYAVQWLKTLLVCIVTFCGAAFAIMTFNNDGSVGELLTLIYESLMGKEKDLLWVLQASYSLGLGVGIIVFFNHFKRKKMLLDPTPIEVKMRVYEDEVNTALIQNASRKESQVDIR